MAKYKFCDIAYNITEKKRPVPDDKETYIGLEHMDSGSLSINRYGSEVPLKGEKLVMKKGDILFGRRNAYLKRAAIAPHDGIFSAHGMILRPKIEVVTEKFFPFFIASDYFMDKAIQISVGSMSPTVNWSTLKNVEFNLPDIKEQEKLGSLLWAANETKEAYQKLLSLSADLIKSQFIETFGDPLTNPMGWEIRNFASLGKWQSGGTPSRKVPEYFTGDINWYSAGELNDRYLKGSIEKITRTAIDESAAKLFKAGSMLVGMYDTAALKLGILVEDSASNQACANILPNEDVNIIWLYEVIQTMKDNLLMKRQGSRQRNLSLTLIKSFEVPLPPIELQNQFVDFVRQSDKAKFDLQQTILSLENTIKSLI
jgi:type I restriction enzyme, S subunit